MVDEPAAAATAGGSAGGYADMATEYLNTATELGKQYSCQAAEVAQQYLGQLRGEWLEGVCRMASVLFRGRQKEARSPMQQLLSVSKELVDELTAHAVGRVCAPPWCPHQLCPQTRLVMCAISRHVLTHGAQHRGTVSEYSIGIQHWGAA